MQFEIFPFLGLDTFIYLILQVTQLIFFTFKPQPLVFLHSWAILVKHDLYNSCSIDYAIPEGKKHVFSKHHVCLKNNCWI